MRLIDADALIEKCNEDMEAVKDLPQRQDGILDAIMNIDECPTIEERKTGNWKWGFADNGWADWTCSECGWTENNDIHVSLGYKYCPHCGAYMKGVISDEEKNKRYMESLEKEESDDN